MMNSLEHISTLSENSSKLAYWRKSSQILYFLSNNHHIWSLWIGTVMCYRFNLGICILPNFPLLRKFQQKNITTLSKNSSELAYCRKSSQLLQFFVEKSPHLVTLERCSSWIWSTYQELLSVSDSILPYLLSQGFAFCRIFPFYGNQKKQAELDCPLPAKFRQNFFAFLWTKI